MNSKFEIKIHNNSAEFDSVPPIGPNSFVQIHYEGKLLSDGTIFDSSIDRDEPFTFQAGQKQVIKGWEEAVKQLKKGHKATLTCPPDYAYGAKGAPPVIPPDATLVFELEVLDVNKGIRLSHILMKHNECSIAIDRCRNKKVTRTKAEAISALQNIRDNIVRQG